MPWAKKIQVEVGYRYSDYSYNKTTDTYKLAGDYVPIDGVRIRASYQRAVRAGSIAELIAADMAFHMYLYEISGNGLFVDWGPWSVAGYAPFNGAGAVGTTLANGLGALVGWQRYVVWIYLVTIGVLLLFPERFRVSGPQWFGLSLLIVSAYAAAIFTVSVTDAPDASFAIVEPTPGTRTIAGSAPRITTCSRAS